LAATPGKPYRLLTALAVVAACAACTPSRDTPRVGCILAGGLEPRVLPLLQDEIDRWGTPRVAEIVPMTSRPDEGGTGAEVAMADRLIAMPALVAAVGHMGSRPSLVVAPMYADAGIPLLVPIGTSTRLKKLGPLVFSMAPDEDAEAEFIVRFALEHLRLRRLSVYFFNGDEYAIGLRSALQKSLERYDQSPADLVGFLSDTDFDHLAVSSFGRAAPDGVVVIAPQAETGRLIHALHAHRPGLPVIAGDGAMLTAGFARTLGASASSVYGVAFWHGELDRASSREFVARTKAAGLGEVSSFSAMMYDALRLLAVAVRRVGPGRDAVRRYLASLGTERPPYEGVSGPISFSERRPINLVMTQATADSVRLVPFRGGTE
jgi:branched-chain amino acid transport system substrate-binding protein